ncbi:MAG: hypothetical protein ACJATI_003766, partial [Halioglobus sp.]
MASSYNAAGLKIPNWLSFATKTTDWLNEIVQGYLPICLPGNRNNSCVVLNDEDNSEGFEKRYNNGIQDAEAFWEDMNPDNPNRTVYVSMNSDNEIIGDIDIVAHSMGFAHAMGMISVLKDHMAPDIEGNKKLGRFYILAPENSCSIGNIFSVNDFEEVWQYGSNPNSLKLWELDGIAVQCEDEVNMPQANKVYLEDYEEATRSVRDFLNAHYSSNYNWIFENILDD